MISAPKASCRPQGFVKAQLMNEDFHSRKAYVLIHYENTNNSIKFIFIFLIFIEVLLKLKIQNKKWMMKVLLDSLI